MTKDDTRNAGQWDEISSKRDLMKCPDFSKISTQSDQQKKLPQPPLSHQARGEVLELPTDFGELTIRPSYAELLDVRRSGRKYDKRTPLTQEQLAFLLWSAQGIQSIIGKNYATLRPVPSGGARHPFEIYVAVRDVEGLAAGLYHYLPALHIGEKRVAVEYVKPLDDYAAVVTDMLAGQKWAAKAPAVVFLSCVAYRAEWRYGTFAHRVALIDLGHVGQNLMLSATALELTSCCMAAYDQSLCDTTLGLDGDEEYTVYACSVGRAV